MGTDIWTRLVREETTRCPTLLPSPGSWAVLQSSRIFLMIAQDLTAAIRCSARSTVILSARGRNPGEIGFSSAGTCRRQKCLTRLTVAASCG